MNVRRFTLSKKFLEPYTKAKPPFGPLGYIVYKRTYSRFRDPEDPEKGTEEWWETCQRVIEGMFTIQKNHCAMLGLPWNDAKAQRTAKEAYDRLFNLKWTPPGRGLWMMGTPFIQRTGAALMNCAFVSTSDIANKGSYIFAWMMDALMLGVGVGFDTKGAGKITIKAPGSESDTPLALYPVNNYYNVDGQLICQIADSREGWVESLVILLDAFYLGGPLPKFDYSRIRQAGELIKGFGGVSSGYRPLEDLHKNLIKLYSQHVGEPISSSVIVDTQNLIGRCVVAGNVRRSAALSLGLPGDEEFLKLKDLNDFEAYEKEAAEKYGRDTPEYSQAISEHPLRHHRWGSNNSIIADGIEDYKPYVDLMVRNGEPGFLWLENLRTRGRFIDPPRDDDTSVMGVNPCGEQQLESWEMCNLVETFPYRHESLEDYLRTLKIAYLYAKTVTLVRTHWSETNALMLKNRRIGLSVSGFMQLYYSRGRQETIRWLDTGYNYVQQLDKKYSDWLCIPRSKRTTSIKPSGSVSKLVGAWPGIHHPESEYYLQRIRLQDGSELLEALRAHGYPVEPDAYSPNTSVVTIPVHTEGFARGKNEVSMWEQLEIAALAQRYWADNSVSVTVTFRQHEIPDIPYALQHYSDKLKAVSFLPYKETGYVQAPYEPCTREQYLELAAKITPITNLNTTDSEGVGEKYCSNDSCEI